MSFRSALVPVFVSLLALTACNSSQNTQLAEINDEVKFSAAEYGVVGSPRVTKSKKVKKGGGRYQVGKPYKIRGKWYKPKEDPTYAATGKASWYGPNFHGRLTANGEVYDQYHLSAAHPTLPLPSYVRVTNLDNKRSVMVRVNDRGPFAHGRIIDLSSKAADLLDFKKQGIADVRVEYVGKARMDGLDGKFLLASYRGPAANSIVPGATMPGTMLAMNDKTPVTPVAAVIDKQFAAEPAPPAVAEPVAAPMMVAGLPVPLRRPAYIPDGIPLLVAEEPGNKPVLMAGLQPLGYVEDNPVHQRIASAFATFDAGSKSSVGPEALERSASQFSPEAAAERKIIEIGRFQDAGALEFSRSRLSDIGLVSIRETGEENQPIWILEMVAGGDVAAAVLGQIHDRGFSRAAIIR